MLECEYTRAIGGVLDKTLAEFIQQRREELGLSRLDIERRMTAVGSDLNHNTLESWENRPGNKWERDWNPDFLSALAEVLETDELKILHELGFPVVPEGFTFEDVVLAKRINAAPPEKRKEAVQMLLAIMDRLGI